MARPLMPSSRRQTQSAWRSTLWAEGSPSKCERLRRVDPASPQAIGERPFRGAKPIMALHSLRWINLSKIICCARRALPPTPPHRPTAQRRVFSASQAFACALSAFSCNLSVAIPSSALKSFDCAQVASCAALRGFATGASASQRFAAHSIGSSVSRGRGLIADRYRIVLIVQWSAAPNLRPHCAGQKRSCVGMSQGVY
jgi:hypothetical protein